MKEETIGWAGLNTWQKPARYFPLAERGRHEGGDNWLGWPKYLAEAGTLLPPCRALPPWRRRQFAVGHESWGQETLHITKVRIIRVQVRTRVPQCMSPVGIGTLPTPMSPASEPLPPRTGGEHTRLPVRVGGVPIRRLEKKLSTLPTLCCIRMVAKRRNKKDLKKTTPMHHACPHRPISKHSQ